MFREDVDELVEQGLEYWWVVWLALGGSSFIFNGKGGKKFGDSLGENVEHRRINKFLRSPLAIGGKRRKRHFSATSLWSEQLGVKVIKEKEKMQSLGESSIN